QHFLMDVDAVEGGEGADIKLGAVLLGEGDEPQILDPARLAWRHREQHRFGKLLNIVEMERELATALAACLDLRRLGIAARRIDANAERPVPDAGAEGDGGDMALPDPPQRKDEANRAWLEARLIPMAHDAGVEQR